MAYDFPASPTEDQEYTPPVGGQTYIYKAPRWLVLGIPPTGESGSSGGIDEAPVDAKQYGRQSAAWTEVVPNPTWTTLSGKPATFPPTVPIAWTDVSGKPATFPPTLPIPSSGVTGLDAAQTAQDSAIATKLNSSAYTAADVLTKVKTVDGVGSGLDADLLDAQEGSYYLAWANFTGKPTTFPPTLPIAESDVTNLVSDLAAKAPLASPTFTGDPKAPTPATADNDTSIATTAHVQANMALKANVTHTHAQSDVTNLTADLALKAPLAAPVFTGDARAVTPATADNDTSIATTAHVQANMALKANATHTHAQSDVTNLTADLALKAPLASPAFTGSPTAPTAGAGTSTSQLATTAFVTNAVAATVTISAAAPGSPSHGALWWNSSNGNLLIYFNDGTSSQWVAANS